jgi:hypothetical protein
VASAAGAPATVALPFAANEWPWVEHPTLAALRERLDLVLDCWNLLHDPAGGSRRETYIPRGPREPDFLYFRRVATARPTGFFRDALRTYAGMLSTLHYLALPPSLTAVLSDVDGRGTDLGVFLFVADLLVLRDGGALVLVLPPAHRWPSEGDRQRALARGDRDSLPRLALVARANLLNWSADPLDALYWRDPIPPVRRGDGPQVHYLSADASRSLDPQQYLYRTLFRSGRGVGDATFDLRVDPNHSRGVAQAIRGNPLLYDGLTQIPAIWYAADGAPFGEGDLPHLGLANQYLLHYRLKSEYEDLLSRTALPVGVRTGLVDRYGNELGVADGAVPARQPAALHLSTNTFLDLPEGADFNWKEIRARSLAEHRAYLAHLDDTMRRDALVPVPNRGAGRSDTEVSLTAGQAFALLQSLASQKTSVFSTLLGHWCAQTGETLSAGAGLSLTVTPLTPPPRPQPTMAEWLTLQERGIVSAAELRHQLALAAAPGVASPVSQNQDDQLAPGHPAPSHLS